MCITTYRVQQPIDLNCNLLIIARLQTQEQEQWKEGERELIPMGEP